MSPRRRRHGDTGFGGKPQALGDVVQSVLGDLGLDEALQAQDLSQRWETVVGKELAAHCKPVRIRDGVLEVEVDSPVWAQQLQFRRAEVLEALGREMGEAAPNDVRVRVG